MPPAPDVRLIAVDMDGTLLDSDHRLPPSVWPVLDQLDRRGIAFCPASGRQHATLVGQFGPWGERLVVIAENGAYVARGDRELTSTTLDGAVVTHAVRAVRGLAAEGADVGVVVCGKRSAWVERTDPPFLAEARRYYARLSTTADLLTVDDAVLKVAVFAFGSAEAVVTPRLQDLAATHQVAASSEHWVDVMERSTHKGAALAQVQAALGVTREQTMAFGDYLNDLEMLDAAAHSWAMANAHPTVRAHARHLAPSNDEDGVVRTIASVLGLGLGNRPEPDHAPVPPGRSR